MSNSLEKMCEYLSFDVCGVRIFFFFFFFFFLVLVWYTIT